MYILFTLCEIMCIYIDCCVHHAYHVRVDLGVDVICIDYRACIFMRLVGVLTPGVCPFALFSFILDFVQVASVPPAEKRSDTGQCESWCFFLG